MGLFLRTSFFVYLLLVATPMCGMGSAFDASGPGPVSLGLAPNVPASARLLPSVGESAKTTVIRKTAEPERVAALQRQAGRQAMREFDKRVVSQAAKKAEMAELLEQAKREEVAQLAEDARRGREIAAMAHEDVVAKRARMYKTIGWPEDESTRPSAIAQGGEFKHMRDVVQSLRQRLALAKKQHEADSALIKQTNERLESRRLELKEKNVRIGHLENELRAAQRENERLRMALEQARLAQVHSPVCT